MTISLRILLFCCLISAGCGGEAATPVNSVTNTPADEKAKIEDILKQYGVTKKVAAVRDNGDYWHVAVEDPPPAAASNDGKPVVMSSGGPPEEFKVYKDGRVTRAFDDKPLKKK